MKKDVWEENYRAWKVNRDWERNNPVVEVKKANDIEKARREIASLGLQNSGRHVFETKMADEIETDVVQNFIRPNKKFIAMASFIAVLAIFVFLLASGLNFKRASYSHAEITIIVLGIGIVLYVFTQLRK